MSRYTDLANELYQARKASDYASMAYSEFLPLRAMVSINPNNVGVKWQRNGVPVWGGVDSPGMMWLDVPGLWSSLPLAGGGTKSDAAALVAAAALPAVGIPLAMSQASTTQAGIFNPKLTSPGVFLTDWVLSDARVQGLLPSNYVALINALRSIYMTRIFGKGILTSDEENLIRKLLDAGVAVWMMTKSTQQAQTITRYNPNQKTLRSDAFYAAAEAFKPAISAYNKNNIQQAMADIQTSERNIVFWDGVYATVKFIHEVPAHLVTAAGTVVTSVTGSAASVLMDTLMATIKSSWPLLLVGGAAYIGYRKFKKR